MPTSLRSLVEQLHEATSVAPSVVWELDASRKPKVNVKGTKVSVELFVKSSAGGKKEVEVDLPDLTKMLVDSLPGETRRHAPKKDLGSLEERYPHHDASKLKLRPKLKAEYLGEMAADVVGEVVVSGDAVECPYCEGKGYVEDYTDEYSHSFGHYTKETSDKCEECDGKGTIEIDDTYDVSLDPYVFIDEDTGNWDKDKSEWIGNQA